MPKHDRAANDSRTDVAIFLNEYVNEYIRFADNKVGLSLTVVSVMVAAVFAADINWPALLFESAIDAKSLLAWSFVILTVTSFVVGISAVYPRTSDKPTKGIVFWDSVAAHGTAHAYSSAFLEADEIQLQSALAEQHYYLSQTARRKYAMLRWLLPLTAVASGLGLTSLLVL